MEKIENKKILIGVGVVALLAVVYYMMKKKKVVEEVSTSTTTTTTTTTPVNPTGMTRAEMTDAIFEANQFRWKEGDTKAIYDRFNDEELKMIYDVDVKKVGASPEFITMLKKYGWA
jgi:hypothetical protein